jgi:nitrogen fixation/metabolism regulation signal transduction histidine kinase
LQKEVQFMQTENIGELEYNSIYLPIRPAGGQTLGYLNIPDFASQNELNQEISNFLVALINLFVFIFLLAGIITFVIANRITSSFALIGEKMKNISFGKQNDPIDWQRNDEIGVLVAQYNRMLNQLDDSANKLAKSERENAWREMAKQVAHEIKNPLTPMKLSLQYLQRAIDNNSPNVKDLTEKVATNMVEQIDHLSKIASDFSQFAHIGVEKKELLDLGDMILQVVTLYENNRKVSIIWKKLNAPAYIEADKTQVNRLFTNLFQNAVQAAKEESALQLTITETTDENHVTVCVADNGVGIPEQVKDKIFVPSFTTKSSGTGLGLAICKDIVERMGGEIWFETKLGEGTQFYVRLPLVEV